MKTRIDPASRNTAQKFRLRSVSFAALAIAVTMQVASAGSTTITMGSSVNPSFDGQVVTFIATVNPPTATGTVSFGTYAFVEGTGTLNAQGVATFTEKLYNLGTHELIAFYNGDALNLPSHSDIFTQFVTLQLFPPPPGLTPNVLVNPGAENLQTFIHDWTGGGTYSAQSPHSGLYSFASGPSPTFLSQTVSLLQFVTRDEIQTGNVSAGFSYWYRSTGQNGPPPTFQITLSFYDDNNNVIAQGRTTIRIGGSAWTNDSGSFLIPQYAVKEVYTMDILFGEGISFVDDNVLAVSHPPLTTNLLFNPGAESGALAPNWWPDSGSLLPAVVTGSSYFGAGGSGAHSGTDVFYGGQTSASYVSQTTDLSKVSGITTAQIDAGAYTSNYSFWFANRNTSLASFGRITLTYYDANKKPISQNLAAPVIGTSWTNESGYFALPPLTRFIVYTMDFNSPGLLDTGVFDDNVLTIGAVPLI